MRAYKDLLNKNHAGQSVPHTNLMSSLGNKGQRTSAYSPDITCLGGHFFYAAFLPHTDKTKYCKKGVPTCLFAKRNSESCAYSK